LQLLKFEDIADSSTSKRWNHASWPEARGEGSTQFKRIRYNNHIPPLTALTCAFCLPHVQCLQENEREERVRKRCNAHLGGSGACNVLALTQGAFICRSCCSHIEYQLLVKEIGETVSSFLNCVVVPLIVWLCAPYLHVNSLHFLEFQVWGQM